MAPRVWRVVALAPLLVCLAAAGASAANGADWTQFRFGTTQSGANPFETTLTPSTVGQLQQRWAARLGAEILWPAPLVLGDETVVSVSSRTTVVALRTSTGQRIWAFHADAGSSADPVAAGAGRIYVSTVDGPLYALDAATGALLWQRALGGSFGGGAVVAGGVVYVPGGGRLWALDAASGRTLWTRGVRSANTSTPAVSGGIVVVGTLHAAWALRTATGRVIWMHRFAGGTAHGTGLSIVGGSAYATGGARLARIALRSGRVVWERTLAAGRIVSSPAVADGAVFAHVESATAERLTARSTATGKVLWSAPFPHGGSFSMVNSSPAVAGGVVYMGFTDGHLRAFGASTGAPLASFALDDAVFSSPSVANGQVEIGTVAGTLYAFSLP